MSRESRPLGQQMQDIEDDESLSNVDKAILILALINLARYEGDVNSIMLKHKDKLEQIRRELAYVMAYDRDTRQLKQLLDKVQEDLTVDEVGIVSDSLVDSYKYSSDRLSGLIDAEQETEGQRDNELTDEEIENDIVYKEFYGDTFDSRIDRGNKKLVASIGLIVDRGLRSGKDIAVIDKEVHKAINDKAKGFKVLFENEIMRVFNISLLSRIALSGKKFVYNAYLDQLTCSECESDDGQLFDRVEDLIPLPRHPRCRCSYTVL